jgi:hypothetical protein
LNKTWLDFIPRTAGVGLEVGTSRPLLLAERGIQKLFRKYNNNQAAASVWQEMQVWYEAKLGPMSDAM